MTMRHQLTSLTAGTSQTSTVHNVIQAGFQQDNQVVTGLAGKAVSLSVVATELLLHHTVGETSLLLLLELQQVLGFLDASATCLSRRVRALLKRLASANKIDAEAAGLTGCGAGITSHI